MSSLLMIGLGGFCGAILRYLVSSNLQRLCGAPFVGTLAVNVVGCALIGLLNGLAESRQFMSGEIRFLLVVGFLGSFTTYSTFGYDTLSLARQPGLGIAALNIGLHLGLGLAAVYLGQHLGRLI